MSPFLGEFIGTAILFLLGAGVVANVVLNKTNGQNSGWIVITFGWAMAVFIGVFTSLKLGGSGHSHFEITEDADPKKAIFCTAPGIRKPLNNVFTEFIGTFILMFGALSFTDPTSSMGTLNALPVSLLVLGIGLSLGGPTGYAINPARDLGPRIAHFILPIKGKRDSDWGYSWVPIVGPILGAILAAVVFKQLN